ncbi:HD domain-containing protein [Aneurinibacillus sp. Ricciae_BoGa-3]|uniref:HD domain-containing protein n=1 Tax=Aneurinibacillus sp. Ricciae_BoGa-3 TaxID=3022697 RepID=UPI002342874C|nr:HD domain-containing protein [Aneurinibacillus sp. Ricciae_BoGa-3]WCK54390.1 HD domain-containing protein [Aneurinibacillus sp. Ricciae_BoGa-3]
MTGRLQEEKVFKDPVHRYVHVRDKLIWDLIGTREFQRLRRIRQLGTCYMTFHGAEHSRFNHSLGVYEVMRRIVNNFEGRIHFTDEERLLCLSAALLHDIGHGPFSHSFEKVFHTDHEAWTQQLIRGDTQINSVLRKVSPDFPDYVAQIIGKTYKNKLITSLISSQFDADRMDYLLRDTYYTGTNYGSYDIERILRVMRPYNNMVVIKHTGMHAVEDYIVARYQMYWQVYFHPVTRSAEVILQKIFQRVKFLYRHGYAFARKPDHFLTLFDQSISLDEYLALDESVVLFYMSEWCKEKDDILRDLCDRFINRRLFVYIEHDDRIKDAAWKQGIEELFRKAGIDPDYYLVEDSPSDLPYDIYGVSEENGEKTPIYLLMPSGNLEELSLCSPIVEAISGKRRFDHKLYFPLDLLEDGTRESEVMNKIKHMLRI